VRNVGIIAVNELSNLLRSKLILIVGAVYVLLFVKDLVGLHVPGDPYYSQTLSMIHMMGGTDPDYYTTILLNVVGYTLWHYGAFFGIVLGVYTVAIERYGNTLGNLSAKPLFRDTIINGKLLGCSLFILAVFLLTILVYTVCIMVWWGNAFLPLAEDYFIRLPVIAGVSLVYVLFFFSLSMLVSLIVTDLAFALIVSVMAKFFIADVPTAEISGKLTTLLGMSYSSNPLKGIIPDGIMSNIFKNPIAPNNILKPSDDLFVALSGAMPGIATLCVYVIILIIVSYIVFLRRDVA
jgi:ABC-2 type transport system permease protein